MSRRPDWPIVRARAARGVPISVILERLALKAREIDIAALLAAALCSAVAAAIVVTTIAVTAIAYTPLPYYDSFGYVDPAVFTLRFLFTPHNEHHIVVPSVLFYLDDVLDHARNTLLLVANYAVQLVTAVLVTRLTFRAVFPRDPLTRVGIAAGLVAVLFSAMQFTNWVWGFQVQFFLSFAFALSAIVFLVEGFDRRSDWMLPIAAALAGVGAAWSLANGVLIWPVAIALAAILRYPMRVPALLAAAGAFSVAAFSLGGSIVPAFSEQHGGVSFATFEFFLAYLGAPVSLTLGSLPVFGLSAFSIPIAVTAGLCGLAAVVLFAAGAMRRGAAGPATWGLAAIAAYVALTGLITAFGRTGFGLSEALTSRYTTGSILFWCAIAALSLAVAGGRSPRARRATAVLWLILLIIVPFNQKQALANASTMSGWFRQAELAIGNGVADPAADRRIYPDETGIVQTVPVLRRDHASVFTEEWTEWPGSSLSSTFSARETDCDGSFSAPSPVAGGTGSIIEGLVDARDAKTGAFVVTTALDGRIDGVARVGDVVDVPGMRRWSGYASDGSSSRAYLVGGDGSVCALASVAAAQPIDKTVSVNLVPDSEVSQVDRWQAVRMHPFADAIRGWEFIGNGHAAPFAFAASPEFAVRPGSWVVASSWVDARSVRSGTVIGIHAFAPATGVVAAALAPAGYRGRVTSAPYRIPQGVNRVHVGPNLNGAVVDAGRPVRFAEFQLEYVSGPAGSPSAYAASGEPGEPAFDDRLARDVTRWSSVGFAPAAGVHGDANGWDYRGNGRASSFAYAASPDFPVTPGRTVVTSAFVDARAASRGVVIGAHLFAPRVGIVAAAYAPAGTSGRVQSQPYRIPAGVTSMHVGPNMNGATVGRDAHVLVSSIEVRYVDAPKR